MSTDQITQGAVQALGTLTSSVAACKNAFGTDLNNLAAQFKPASPQVLGAVGGGDQASTASLNTPGTASAAGAGASGFKASDYNNTQPNELGAIAPVKMGEEIGGAKGGGHVGEISPGGAAGASGNGGARKGDSGLLTSILSGFFGGGGGSGSSGSGWKSFFGGGSGNGNGAAPSASVKNKMPDLRQFLPGGLQDPTRNRGIAGQFVGLDGLTGPHSDIWRQINNR